MFCTRSANNKINKLHERAIRIVYDDNNSKFEELLTKDSSFVTHHQNIRNWKQKMFTNHHGVLQVSFLDLSLNYNENNFHIWWSQPDFQISRINTTLKGTKSVRYFGLAVWNNISLEISIKSLNTFKTEIRKWKPKNFWCRLWKTYVKDFSFVNISQ